MAGGSVHNVQQAAAGFNFTDRMRQLCRDVSVRLLEMQHIDVTRIAFSFAQTRKRVRHGMWASLTPMRFAGGAETGVRNGRRYAAQRLFADGQEMLYVLTFYLPRFMELSFNDKLVTVFHELWHISPGFDGDIRRYPGRCYAHTQSEREYDAAMAILAKKWLAMNPPQSCYAFLHKDFAELQREFGPVYGNKVRHPQLIPLE